MNNVPTLAWIAIGIIALVLIALNIGMVIILRDPKKFKLERKAPRSTAPDLGKLVQVLRDPFADERGQLQELSKLVKDLEEKQPPAENEK